MSCLVLLFCLSHGIVDTSCKLYSVTVSRFLQIDLFYCRTGSLSLSATRQAQLMAKIRQNPEFLKGMRAQLQGVFEDLLDKRGVPRVRVTPVSIHVHGRPF